MKANRKRVVVTGLGITTCLGSDVDTFFNNLVGAECGIRSHADIPDNPVGLIDYQSSDYFSKSKLFTMDRVSQLAVIASKQAVKSASLSDLGSSGTGVLYGCSLGGANTLEETFGTYYGAVKAPKKLSIPMAMVHAPAAQVSIHLGVYGECQSYSTACSSSAVAIGEGFRRIRDGYLSVAITGGAECMLVNSVIKEWKKLGVLAKSNGSPSLGCRPFTKDRNGFHLSEGAATLVLEEYEHAKNRKAVILAEIVGYGVSNDGLHITKPDAYGQSVAINNALDDASLDSSDIKYINSHGTSTVAGDRAEANSIRKVFGDLTNSIPVSATKSSHGHAIGAVGAIEAVITIKAIQESVIPPTPFVDHIDPEASLNLVMGSPKRVDSISYAISNSFAFGGNNAVLVFGKYS